MTEKSDAGAEARKAAIGRRRVLKGGALSALVFTLDGVEIALTPREARAADVPLQILNAPERATLESFGNVLLPGAAEAGIAPYVDHQLAADHGDCLLIARVLDVPPPIANFYRGALSAIEAASQKIYRQRFAALTPAQQNAFVRTMTEKDPDGWTGPPAPFVFFLLRNDATDVVYGTEDAYKKLGVPYMPHILPQKKW